MFSTPGITFWLKVIGLLNSFIIWWIWPARVFLNVINDFADLFAIPWYLFGKYWAWIQVITV